MRVDDFSSINLASRGPHDVRNHMGGEWQSQQELRPIPDPLTGDVMLRVPDTRADDAISLLDMWGSCPKSGLHNPYKNVSRYLMLGQVCARAATALAVPEVEDFFTLLIQRVMPKSYIQARGEVVVTRNFLYNFSGDQVRFLANGFVAPGDYDGQRSIGHRWPFGPVVIICPFNFPLEIPALQLMGALFMGNRPLLKVDSKVSIVAEEFLRLLFYCGLPSEDVDLLHCRGSVMGEIMKQIVNTARLTQFTGSSEVAELLAVITGGRIKIEDSGLGWKLIGPDITSGVQFDKVSFVSDQDTNAASGQKCSAESFLALPRGSFDSIVSRLDHLASRRALQDLTVGPILTWSDEALFGHLQKVLALDGAKVLFGNKFLSRPVGMPREYGTLSPTAIYVPLETLVMDLGAFVTATTEVFAPFKVVTSYGKGEAESVLTLLERMNNHLTAAIVSQDAGFINRVLGATVNGTTYVGVNARTTGAPQQHWFGPAGDPRACGIGSPGAIITTWSGHREVVEDMATVADDYVTPPAS